MTENDLHQYQLQAVDHIISHTHCALFLDMGLGKTVSQLKHPASAALLRRHLHVSFIAMRSISVFRSLSARLQPKKLKQGTPLRSILTAVWSMTRQREPSIRVRHSQSLCRRSSRQKASSTTSTKIQNNKNNTHNVYAAGIDINSCRLHVSVTQTSHINSQCQTTYCLLCRRILSILQTLHGDFCRQRTIVIALPHFRFRWFLDFVVSDAWFTCLT